MSFDSLPNTKDMELLKQLSYAMDLPIWIPRAIQSIQYDFVTIQHNQEQQTQHIILESSLKKAGSDSSITNKASLQNLQPEPSTISNASNQPAYNRLEIKNNNLPIINRSLNNFEVLVLPLAEEVLLIVDVTTKEYIKFFLKDIIRFMGFKLPHKQDCLYFKWPVKQKKQYAQSTLLDQLYQSVSSIDALNTAIMYRYEPHKFTALISIGEMAKQCITSYHPPELKLENYNIEKNKITNQLLLSLPDFEQLHSSKKQLMQVLINLKSMLL